MDYAIQLLLPILLGIFLGAWLTNEFGASPIWTVLFAVLGMFGGIGVLYKQSMMKSNVKPTHYKKWKPGDKPTHPKNGEDPLAFLRTDIRNTPDHTQEDDDHVSDRC